MQTAIAIRALTANECAILDMGGCLAAGVPSTRSGKCSTSINLEPPFLIRGENADEDDSRATKMTFRNLLLTLPLVAIAAAGCVRPAPAAVDTGGQFSVRIVLETRVDTILRTFVAPVRVTTAPRPLPAGWLPGASIGGGMVAVTAGDPQRAARSWIFVLHDDTSVGRRVTVFRLSGAESVNVESLVSDMVAGPTAPCQSWTAFFVKGVGDAPRGPVVLRRWENGGPSRGIVVDPARHTLHMRPILRFSTRDVRGLRERAATFLLRMTITGGRAPFLILGLARRPDGSYTEAVFTPEGKTQGWGGFVNLPDAAIEFSFYALTEPSASSRPCRQAISQ